MIQITKSYHLASDRDLERRIAAFLADRSVPALRRLFFKSRHGVVTLRGRVGTFYEKQLAAHVTRRVAGVVQLIDDVQVRPSRSAAETGKLLAKNQRRAEAVVRRGEVSPGANGGVSPGANVEQFSSWVWEGPEQ